MKIKSSGEKKRRMTTEAKSAFRTWKVEVLNVLVDVMPLSLSKSTDTAAAAASHYWDPSSHFIRSTLLVPGCWIINGGHRRSSDDQVGYLTHCRLCTVSNQSVKSDLQHQEGVSFNETILCEPNKWPTTQQVWPRLKFCDLQAQILLRSKHGRGFCSGIQLRKNGSNVPKREQTWQRSSPSPPTARQAERKIRATKLKKTSNPSRTSRWTDFVESSTVSRSRTHSLHNTWSFNAPRAQIKSHDALCSPSLQAPRLICSNPFLKMRLRFVAEAAITHTKEDKKWTHASLYETFPRCLVTFKQRAAERKEERTRQKSELTKQPR